jgi:hypothetical protein
MELDLFAVDPQDSGNYQCKRDQTILKNVVLVVNSAVSGSLQTLNALTLYAIGFIFTCLRYY